MAISLANLTIGQQLPERKFEVNRAEVLRYAAASGDFNPLHLDDATAQSAGMQRAFAHGMFSAGCLATALTDALGVQSLTRLAVRFRAQAWLGSTLNSDIVVAGIRREADHVVVDLDCRLLGDDELVISGGAVVATSARPQDSDEPTAPPVVSTSQLLGKRLTPAVVSIERGPVQFFATAVGDDSPVYRSAEAAAACGLGGIPVPPTYIFAAAHWGTFADRQPSAPEGAVSLVELIASLRAGRKGVILHGGQEFNYYAPLRVGEIVHVDGYVEAIEQKAGTENRPGMTVMTVRTDYRDASARLLTTARATYLFRPATRG